MGQNPNFGRKFVLKAPLRGGVKGNEKGSIGLIRNNEENSKAEEQAKKEGLKPIKKD